MPESESVEIDGGWDILARARGGSREAWEALFRQYSPRLLRIAALLTGSTDAARDCVQETFVRELHSVVHHHGGSLRAYLSIIAYRLALKENAHLRRRAAAGDIDVASPDPSPLVLVITEERERSIVEVIRGLPFHHRDLPQTDRVSGEEALALQQSCVYSGGRHAGNRPECPCSHAHSRAVVPGGRGSCETPLDSHDRLLYLPAGIRFRLGRHS